MLLNIGDLVWCRSHGKKMGIVVDKRPSNEGLDTSMHVRHIVKNYPPVYYIYFSGEGKMGPYHASDIILQQNFKQVQASIDESLEVYSL
jgi:hypothetical protein